MSTQLETDVTDKKAERQQNEQLLKTAVDKTKWVDAGFLLYRLITSNAKLSELFQPLPTYKRQQKQRQVLLMHADHWLQQLGITSQKAHSCVVEQLLAVHDDLAETNGRLRSALLDIANNPL